MAQNAPDQRLLDRHALVTGGGRGIGLAIATALKAAGAKVTVLGRDMNALEQALANGHADHAVAADVTAEDALAQAIAEAAEALGPIDILVANAGAAESSLFIETQNAAFQRMLDINLMGTVNAARAVLPGMSERGFGRIVSVASTAALKGYPYVSAYVAAKHATLGFVRALALENARTGITVNAVCPGFTDTDLVAQSIETIMAKTGRSRDEALRDIVRNNPQKRLVQPDEVADAVLWLCGDAASSVTGQAIAVAGGEI